jgi:hypothetical protein
MHPGAHRRVVAHVSGPTPLPDRISTCVCAVVPEGVWNALKVIHPANWWPSGVISVKPSSSA